MTLQGLLTVRLHVPPEREDELNDWYNLEHFRQIVSIPGIICARRYVTAPQVPKYLAWYETADEHVPSSPGFKSAADQPTPWSQHMRRFYEDNRIQNIYRLSASCGAEPRPDAPWLYIVQMDCADKARDAEFVEWYEREQMPAFAQVPGVLRVRRYIDVAGTPRYLNAYELTDRGVFNSPGWVAVRKTPRAVSMQTLITNGQRAMYQLI